MLSLWSDSQKEIRWFSLNPKSHLCLAYCPEHGYFKGKARIKKTDEGKYYVVRTLKQIEEEEADLIRQKKEELRKKRRLKRHSEKAQGEEAGTPGKKDGKEKEKESIDFRGRISSPVFFQITIGLWLFMLSAAQFKAENVVF